MTDITIADADYQLLERQLCQELLDARRSAVVLARRVLELEQAVGRRDALIATLRAAPPPTPEPAPKQRRRA